MTVATTAPEFSLKPILVVAFAGTSALMGFVAVLGPMSRVLGLAPWHVGVAVTAAGMAWMLTARIWGARSDRLGRRRVLLAGLIGFAISYVALAAFLGAALAIVPATAISLAGLLIGRTLAGAFYSAVPPVCAAVVADHTPPAGRTRAMGAVGAANAVGMVAGPGLAGLIAGVSLGLSLVVMALLPLVALVAAWRGLPPDTNWAGRPPSALRLTDPRLRRAVAVGFLAMFAVVVGQVVVGFYALDRLGLEPNAAARSAGVALAIVGVSLFISQMLLRRLNWPPSRFIRIGAAVGALGFGAVVLAQAEATLWAGYAVGAAGMGWVYPSLSALAANAVEAHEQGAAAGAVAAAQGLGSVLGPVIGMLLYGLSEGAPYMLVSAALVIAALWPAPKGRPSR